MPRTECHDVPGGDTILYDILDDEGFRLATFNFETAEEAQAHFDNLPNINIRDDDIIVCSYPKTGTNWAFEMISLMMQNTTEVTAGTKIPTMLEAIPPVVPDSLPSPRLLNSHLPVKYLPKGVRDKKIKVVFVVRNPKDVAVSFFNHTKGLRLYQYEGQFDNYVEMFMRGEVDYGSYPDYLLGWQQCIQDNPDWPIHIVYYEDMKKDCFSEMKKMAQYLRIDIADEMLEKIVDNCSMKNIVAGKLKAMDEKTLERVTKQTKNNFSIYRKGQVGDWKNWFKVAKNEAFDSWWEEKSDGIQLFKFRYE